MEEAREAYDELVSYKRRRPRDDFRFLDLMIGKP